MNAFRPFTMQTELAARIKELEPEWRDKPELVKIVNGEQEIFLEENQSTYIPKTHRHRLENPGKIPLQIIEIQTGPYLEEDDIVRFGDIYGRG